ncbi:SNF2 family N-terminal domain-containing protein [Aspergillus coremiiformis]|uniref:SNF2 family N-terminal domain-containing protein n=1 Tax=Aspergillus coremiiformis TaxID=138285 RepID=A0A5N6ZBZ9_9EURO|nr:SNF2 family N-terminal domain-containing protein [Aspergillus coremiiformis]
MDSPKELEQLDVETSLLESIEARREQAGARAALARGMLALQRNTAEASSPSSLFHIPENNNTPENNDLERAIHPSHTNPRPLTSLSQPDPVASTEAVAVQCLDTAQTRPTSSTDIPDIPNYQPQDDLDSPMDFVQALSRFLDKDATQSDRPLETRQMSTESSALGILPDPLPTNVAVSSSSSMQVENADPPSTEPLNPEASDWPDELLDSVDDNDTSEFDAIKSWFKGLKNPTIADKLKYETAKLQEKTRKTRVTNREALRKLDEEDSDSDRSRLFVTPEPRQRSSSREQVPEPDGPDSAAYLTEKPKPAGKRKRQNRISAEEKRRSMQFGLDVVLGRVEKKKSGRKRKAGGNGLPGPSKRSRKNKEQPEVNLETLLSSNLVEDVHASSALLAAPGFTDRNKERALVQLIAGIPTKGKEQAIGDKRMVLEATKKFNHSARSDKKGGWLVKGMKTSLYSYQHKWILGAAFMRDRENSSQSPYGGFLCDTMGFGKTIQTLANIVDGRLTDPDDPVRTTLIVVPSQLVSHWMNQICKHCEPDAIGEVLVYHASAKYLTLDVPKSIQKHNVVITTYDEVRKSYPQYNAPGQIVDGEKLREWWKETYEHEAGPLHQIKFRRIILDEAHIIKNHLSQISIAVRALTGHFKWVLSGTPVHNGAGEFYSLFDFLSVPRTGSYENFWKEYCRGQEANTRLVNLLRSFMFRRTHASRLFSLPVIKLPDIDERIVQAEFCGAERVIYDAIVDAFFEMINGFASKENHKIRQYRCFLTMILKLRMFSSHILTAQDIVKSVLSEDLVRELIAISKVERDPGNPSHTIVQGITAMRKRITLPAAPQKQDDTGPCVDELRGDKEELAKQFKEFMTTLHEKEQWLERMKRSNCASCELMPIDRVITSCMHLYCEECYYLLIKENERRICSSCSTGIETAAKCDFSEDGDINESSSTLDTTKKQSPKKKQMKTKRNSQSILSAVVPQGRDENENEGPDEDEETDWISVSGGRMPSAKMKKVQEIIKGWIDKNPDVKVVIFTQFLDFVRLLKFMCENQKWGATSLTGKMSLGTREQNMEKFRDKKEIRILIASLKAGGIGLDMSMANKCILVDLWWNEAIQDQAFCRLYRIGQSKDVEFVKIIVKNSIDEYLLKMQTRKTVDITSAMGDDILKDRNSIIELLTMFGGTVHEDEAGMIFVERIRQHRGLTA